MRQRDLMLRSCGFVLAALSVSLSRTPAMAADYDQAYQPRPPRVIAGPAVPVTDPRCRVVPVPEHNLYGDTARFRPTLICFSRGMVADSFNPYDSYAPYDYRTRYYSHNSSRLMFGYGVPLPFYEND